MPVAVSGGLSFTALSAGADHTCGLTGSGAVYCWGKNISGQLGTGSMANSSIPVAVLGGLSFTALSAGAEHTCGLTGSGAAYCWGDNWCGQLGDGSRTLFIGTPVAVSGGLAFNALAAASTHTCGLTSAGAAYCWGSNDSGRLGRGTFDYSTVPIAVAFPTSSLDASP